MNKANLIEQVAEKAGISKAAAARAFDAIFNTANGALSQAVHGLGELSIPGFGKFSKKTRAARQGRNPRTGAVIDIPERSTIAFTAGKNLREGSPSGRRRTGGTEEAAPAPSAGKARGGKSAGAAETAKPAAKGGARKGGGR
jgi:DNA-binding protein HU-beta